MDAQCHLRQAPPQREESGEFRFRLIRLIRLLRQAGNNPPARPPGVVGGEQDGHLAAIVLRPAVRPPPPPLALLLVLFHHHHLLLVLLLPLQVTGARQQGVQRPIVEGGNVLVASRLLDEADEVQVVAVLGGVAVLPGQRLGRELLLLMLLLLLLLLLDVVDTTNAAVRVIVRWLRLCRIYWTSSSAVSAFASAATFPPRPDRVGDLESRHHHSVAVDVHLLLSLAPPAETRLRRWLLRLRLGLRLRLRLILPPLLILLP